MELRPGEPTAPAVRTTDQLALESDVVAAGAHLRHCRLQMRLAFAAYQSAVAALTTQRVVDAEAA
jgi:hypothetical protein